MNSNDKKDNTSNYAIILVVALILGTVLIALKLFGVL